MSTSPLVDCPGLNLILARNLHRTALLCRSCSASGSFPHSIGTFSNFVIHGLSCFHFSRIYLTLLWVSLKHAIRWLQLSGKECFRVPFGESKEVGTRIGEAKTSLRRAQTEKVFPVFPKSFDFWAKSFAGRAHSWCRDSGSFRQALPRGPESQSLSPKFCLEMC